MTKQGKKWLFSYFFATFPLLFRVDPQSHFFATLKFSGFRALWDLLPLTILNRTGSVFPLPLLLPSSHTYLKAGSSKGCACAVRFITLPALQKNFVNIFSVFAWEFCIEKWRGFLVNFFWSLSPAKRSTKSPRKIRGKFGAKSGAKFGPKIRKIRETFVLQLFWPKSSLLRTLLRSTCLYWKPLQAPSKNPSKKHLLFKNLLRTLLRSVRLHDPLGVHPIPSSPSYPKGGSSKGWFATACLCRAFNLIKRHTTRTPPPLPQTPRPREPPVMMEFTC